MRRAAFPSPLGQQLATHGTSSCSCQPLSPLMSAVSLRSPPSPCPSSPTPCVLCLRPSPCCFHRVDPDPPAVSVTPFLIPGSRSRSDLQVDGLQETWTCCSHFVLAASFWAPRFPGFSSFPTRPSVMPWFLFLFPSVSCSHGCISCMPSSSLTFSSVLSHPM